MAHQIKMFTDKSFTLKHILKKIVFLFWKELDPYNSGNWFSKPYTTNFCGSFEATEHRLGYIEATMSMFLVSSVRLLGYFFLQLHLSFANKRSYSFENSKMLIF